MAAKMAMMAMTTRSSIKVKRFMKHHPSLAVCGVYDPGDPFQAKPLPFEIFPVFL
jgi:hypothetical protein